MAVRRGGDRLVAGLRAALSGLTLALLVPVASHADNAVAERVLDAYAGLDGYCDTLEKQSRELLWELRRCYARDGRYKQSEQLARSPWRQVRWGDTERAYLWSTGSDGSTTHYAEERAQNWQNGGLPEGLTARALSAFLPGARTEDQARSVLRGFELVEDGVETTVWQHRQKSPLGTDMVDRIWVRRIDGLVVRAEQTWDGKLASSATLLQARVNPSLSEADLSDSAPFFQRYSLSTRPRTFTGALAAASFVAGLVLSLAWRRQRNWRRIWLFYAIGIGVVSACLGVLAVLSLGGSGHPPAIVVPIILGVFAAIGALAVAALMLGMQLGDRARSGRLNSALKPSR